jgi:uncharacterized protein (DUF934 family)
MPRQLLRDGLLTDDDWRYLDEAPGPVGAGLILPFERWHSERDAEITRGRRLGVSLRPGDAVEQLVPDLGILALIAIDFPAANEGRGYSQGRLLRERWHFSGELRATGRVRRDQVFFLARCGFNAFELAATEIEAARAAFASFSAAYQASNDRGLALKLRRRQ